MDSENTFNIYREAESTITPNDFEKLCLELIQNSSNFSSINDVIVQHDVICKTPDGDYQLDGLIEFTLMNVRFKVIIECKRYKNKVKRELVAVLHSKMNSIGAQKGIMISTSGFQYGAVQYAKAHGIALIQIIDKMWLTVQASALPSERLFDRYINMPDYVPVMYDLGLDFPLYQFPQLNGELEKFLTTQ